MALRSCTCTTARAELPAVGLANCKAEHRPAIGNSGMALELGPRRQLQGACLFIRKHGPANKGRGLRPRRGGRSEGHDLQQPTTWPAGGRRARVSASVAVKGRSPSPQGSRRRGAGVTYAPTRTRIAGPGPGAHAGVRHQERRWRPRAAVPKAMHMATTPRVRGRPCQPPDIRRVGTATRRLWR